MRSLIRRAAVVATAAAVLAGLTPALSASANPVTGPAKNGTYLALGDSVAFGFVPAQAVPAPKYRSAHTFVGYPEDVAQALHVRVWNAACPGETTASMLTPGAPSNGCENSPGSPVGYRTQFPLHVQYQGTQMAYALKYLAVHRHTKLVTINIGANDAFLCQETTADHCTSPAELLALVNKIQTNLTTIYTQIRDTAHYQGLLVALTYYSLSYSDPVQVAQAQLLDAVIANVTEAFGGKVADGFAAFQGPSEAAGGSPCAAGLLIKLPGRHVQHSPLACRASVAGQGHRERGGYPPAEVAHQGLNSPAGRGPAHGSTAVPGPLPARRVSCRLIHRCGLACRRSAGVPRGRRPPPCSCCCR